LKKIVLLIVLSCVASGMIQAQIYFSLATDASLLRNLTPRQRFFTFGQTIQGNWHFSKKESAYAWLSFYTNGKFKNAQSAIANDINTSPYQVDYTVTSTLRYRQISLGWKHFFVGSFDSESQWNVYGYAGFGLLWVQITNTYSQTIDTVAYHNRFYITPGDGRTNRLTFDLGAGTEYPLGTDLYLYAELRTWLNASYNPSPYLLDNNIPKMLAANIGLRMLLD
jgi:hypothetical protein